MATVLSWTEIGERIAEARRAAGLSQGEVAERIHLDRTAIVRAEAGSRKISALELGHLSEVLGVPLTHFVSRPPAVITSRREVLDDDSGVVSRERYGLDVELEGHARDAEWLVNHGFLLPTTTEQPPGPLGDASGAIALAQHARKALGIPNGPLGDMADVSERFGLYIVVVDRDVEGASLWFGHYGVGAIGGRAAPGRRRWTAAHELGHHLLRDEYHSDVGVGASRDERERIIDCFAGEFLLPKDDLQRIWETESALDPRDRLIRAATQYRLSWSAAIAAAQRCGVVAPDEVQDLRARSPLRGDFLRVCGSEPVTDLEPGTTGEQWRRAVLAAWDDGAITAPRAVELLHHAITAEDLPERTLDEDRT